MGATLLALSGAVPPMAIGMGHGLTVVLFALLATGAAALLHAAVSARHEDDVAPPQHQPESAKLRQIPPLAA